ncbi:MAG TPA: EamA family transporter [Bacillota bacterium]|nr:EamA family transporter [Clostridiales bacterium]HPT86102.1 EamA family transporter [Bacillota bacterium]
MWWLTAAVLSAVFAGLTAILAKCGIRKTSSSVATALRTIIVLIFSIIVVLIVGSQKALGEIKPASWLFLVLSGFATGASWLCYFKALSFGDVNKVAPIDKLSTVISVLLAIIIFGETNNLIFKLIGIALFGAGTYLMVEKAGAAQQAKGKSWVIYALLSAIFAALTSVLAKIGITGVESNLATAIRTVVVLVMAWVVVFVKGEHKSLGDIDKKELAFIALSGIATGASWLFYYYAVQNGILSVVIPIDKMSILLTVLFSRVFLKEKLSHKAKVGLALMFAGTLVIAYWK